MRRFAFVIAAILLCGNAFAGDLVLSNSKVKLVFADSNEFCMKEFIANGENMVPSGGSNTPVWMMTFLGPNGESPALQPRWSFFDGGKLSEDGRSATFTWRVVLAREDKWPVKVTVSLPDDECELPEWTISADMPEGWKISELEFPRLTVNRPEDAKGIMPVGYGAEYDIPTNAHIQSRYPSCTGTMELVLMHGPSGTAYFSAKDNGGSQKIFRMAGQGKAVTFSQIITASYGWTSKGGHFELPWATVLGFSRENWMETVMKWYRPFSFETPWGDKTIPERKIVGWMKDADVWLRPADATDAMMAAVKKGIEYFGEGIGLHWYYWHGHAFDTYYPEYFPTQPGFKEMVAESRKLGARVVPYINGRLWDPATDSYKKLRGYKASCRKADGTLYTEVYSSKVVNTVTCPASDIWQKVLKNTNKRILNELGTDGVYMDQIGAAESEPCYAENHHHAPGGGDWWPAAYRKVLTEMRNAPYYTDDKVMTTEECAECYIDLFDMMLVVNSPHNAAVKMVPLFPLVYSDRCIYSGYTYVPWRLNDHSMNFLSMKSLLWGSQLGWVNPELLFRPENAKEVAFLKTLADFRKRQHDLVLGGRFMGEFIPGGDNPVIDVPNYQKTNVVMGAKWLGVDGTEAYIVVNMSGEEHSVTMPTGETVIVPAYSAVRK